MPRDPPRRPLWKLPRCRDLAGHRLGSRRLGVSVRHLRTRTTDHGQLGQSLKLTVSAARRRKPVTYQGNIPQIDHGHRPLVLLRASVRCYPGAARFGVRVS